MADQPKVKTQNERSRIRKARIADVPRIRELISFYASRDMMLPRSLHDIYECLRDYWVCDKNGEVIACAALHVNWEDLAEIRSVAVADNLHSHGIGTRLLKRCIREARDLGITRVFALTHVPSFFERHGFRLCNKEELPRKIWAECIRCHKFPDCDETALVLDL